MEEIPIKKFQIPIIRNLVISRNEKSPQLAPQGLTPIGTELLAGITRSSK